MSEIALTVIKVLFLALLWLFILSAVSVIRSDLFGKHCAGPRTSRNPRNSRRPAPAEEGESDSAANLGSL